MASFFTANSILFFLACLAVGSFYAWILYRGNNHLNSKVKIALTVLRTLAVTTLLWLFFAPLIKQITYNLQKPIIVIATDNSISVAKYQPKDFNNQKFKANLLALTKKIANKYQVKTFSFSDTVKTGLDFFGKGKLSNATALINLLNNQLLNSNVGAVIIASDGIFNSGGNPLYELNKIKAPVYTIAMGDTVAKRDLLIANVNYNNLVYLNNEFTANIELLAYQSKGEIAKIYVTTNGKIIAQQTVNINANNFVQNITITLKANQIGTQKYTVNVVPLKNEITTKNNSETLFIDVIDAKQKILIASAFPHPDIATLKQAISSNKNYEVTIALGADLETIDPKKYSLAILYQLPSNNNTALALINKLQPQKLAIWYILGAQTNLTAFNQVQKMVNFSSSNGLLQETFPVFDANFTLYNLEAIAIKQLNNYNPLQMPFTNFNVNGNYTAVLNQRIGKINTQNPLLFFTANNDKKTGFLLGEGIWKWKLEEAKNEQNYPLVNLLINKIVQYLAVKNDKRKFKVFTPKNIFDENENIIINATLYNDAYEAINTPDVKIQVKNTEGKIYNYTFAKVGTAYRLDAGILPQGNYTFLAKTTLGNKQYTANGAFFVNALIAEYQQTTANHQLLYAMAKQSNGQMVMPNNLLSIAAAIEKNQSRTDGIKTISYEVRKYEHLINLKWIFALIVLLLSAEWFIRKRNGEV